MSGTYFLQRFWWTKSIPWAVVIENVRGTVDAVFQDYRRYVGKELIKLGYEPAWKLIRRSADHGAAPRPSLTRKHPASAFRGREIRFGVPKLGGKLGYG